MIAVIDYGMGNIGSIINMFHKIGAEAIATNRIAELENAEKLVLPGVGAFDNGMEKLNELGLAEPIKRMALKEGKPFLGICLGMQLLGLSSEEGKLTGLGLIEFDVRKFRFEENKGLKVPHMGWDVVRFDKPDNKILKGISGQQRYYFVHSYYAFCKSRENVLMTCDYGCAFAAAVCKDNIYGVQFHPEKSHRFGMALLENFVRSI